jgi:UDP-glucose 4-epimerase
MATYLITGGAGFIGSHLADRLLALGHRVIVLDDFSTGNPRNIAHLRGHAGFECHADTVLNRPLLAELIGRSDGVFHLAAAVGVRLVVEHPVRTIETNVEGTKRVLELAARSGTRVLIASSSEVYGKSPKVPLREDDELVLGNTSTGRWGYGCSKALGEYLALAYAREERLPVTVMRLFNACGPRQTARYGMVVPTFVRQALSSRPITVFGDGEQRRCFCYVGDIVEALAEVIEQPRAIGSVFNVGSNEEVTIGELAERVKSLADSRSEIVYVPYEEAWDDRFEDMLRRVPDLGRIRDLIGFEPRTTLDEIIARAIEYERTSPSHPPERPRTTHRGGDR